MSSPVLYKANETNFNHLGLGVLTDAVSCLVTEERNGLFELEMEYPVDGIQFKQIKNDRLIKVDASRTLKDQRFKIIRISKPMKGLVTIYAEHVSYLAQDLALKPDVSYSGLAIQALSTWQNSFVDAHPFTTYSDVKTEGSGKWSLDKVENARLALGGVSGSLLDTYGGEYMFDNYHVMLFEQRGSDSGALIAYGRNLMELTEEELIDSTYTSIYPYAIYTDDNEVEHLITLPEYFLDSQYAGNFARRKLLKVDFSEDEVTTVEDLRSKAESYLVRNNVGMPKVNQKIKFVDLARTLDYDDMQLLEDISLCDIITIYFEKFDLQTKAKVIKTVWDVLLGQYDSIEVGEARASLSRSIDATIDGKLETVTRCINSVQIAANGKNKVYRGADEPANGVKNDLWYKPVGEGEIEMYIHDGAVWHLEKYSGDQVGGTINFANVNAINFNAANIVTGILRSITIEGVDIIGSTFRSDDGESTLWVSGGDVRLTDTASGRNLNLNSLGMAGFNNAGELLFQANRTWVTTGIVGTNTKNGYFAVGETASDISGELRVVHIRGIPGDGEIASYYYLPVRAGGVYSNFVEVNSGSAGNNLYLRPRSGGEVRITSANTTDAYYPLRAGAVHSNNFVSTTTSLWMGTDSAMHVVNKGYVQDSTGDPIYRDIYASDIWARGFITRSTHAYIGADGELRVTNKGLGDIYRDVRALGYFGQYLVADAGLFAYVGTDLGLRVTSRGLADSGPIYRDVIAAGFTNGSRIESKEDIQLWEEDALDIIKNSDITSYFLKGDIEQGRNIRKYGLVIGGHWRTPEHIINGDGADQYAMESTTWRAMQQLLSRVEALENQAS